MKKTITAKICSGYVLVVCFEGRHIGIVEKIEGLDGDKFTKLEKAIKLFVKKYNIRSYRLGFNMSDEESIIQTVKVENTELDEYLSDINHKFQRFIAEGEEDEYVFDFQVLSIGRSKTDVVLVAAHKSIIEEYIGLASKFNKKIELLRPESISISYILRKKGYKKIIVVDLEDEERSIRVFEKKKLIAKSFLPEDEDDSKKILEAIVRGVSCYDENKITTSSDNLVIIGGTDKAHIQKAIECTLTHRIILPKEYVEEGCTDEEASLAFTQLGLMY